MLLGDKPEPFAFTDWSRQQLLSHLGTREKWFDPVSRTQEVAELNARLHAMSGSVFRTMRGFDSPDLNLFRGLVSSRFADLPDTEIMKTLVDLLPEGYALKRFSGKTDRAFYAYALTADTIGVPGSLLHGHPGIVVKNSEVGFTSLYLIPVLYLHDRRIPLVLKRHAVLRRVHRGDVKALTSAFEEALTRASEIWGPFEKRVAGMKSITYASTDTAIQAMTSFLMSAGSDKRFISKCETTYRKATITTHSAMSVFTAVLDSIDIDHNQDAAYVAAELAGAVLMLIK